MTSKALVGLLEGVDEVRALRSIYPTGISRIGQTRALAARAHGRACTVLLCSHFERYIYAVNGEAIDWINGEQPSLSLIPMTLLLQHSRAPIEDIARTDWTRRELKLKDFMSSDGALWSTSSTSVFLDHSQLLTWLKTPKPTDLIRFYRQYEIQDIFKVITRSPRIGAQLKLDLTELSEKRNNIAHGDLSSEALQTDVTRYLTAVAKFSSSADWAFARQLRRITKSSRLPW